MSCSEYDEITETFITERSLRNYTEAYKIAEEAAEIFETRSVIQRTIDINNVQYIIDDSSISRTSGYADTLMYVFNYENEAGFAVISANKATEGLILVTEKGNYSLEEDTENEGFDLYMELANAYVKNAKAKTNSLDDPSIQQDYKIVTTRETLENYGPFVPVRWGQEYPYNLYCFDNGNNQALAGCVATAIAQIMSYYQHPSSIEISYEGSLYTQSLNWNGINSHVVTPSICDECSNYHDQIGKIFREIGMLVNMTYGVNGSSAYTQNAANVFDKFGYSYDAFQDYNSSIVTNSLKLGNIVLMKGRRVLEGGGSSGHAWVIDGYKYQKINETEYTKPIDSDIWMERETHTHYATYNHINWGWNGYNNGYFLNTTFNTGEYLELDFEYLGASQRNYSYDFKMFSNIRKK